MARNKSYTGNRQSVGTPTLRKDEFFQLIKMIRRKEEEIAQIKRKTSAVSKDEPSA